jgi:hypothetical protein
MQKKARGLSWKSAKQFLRGNETWWHRDLKADVAAGDDVRAVRMCSDCKNVKDQRKPQH